MKKVIDYLKENGWKAIAILLLVLYVLKGCTSSKIEKVSDKIDSLSTRIEKLEDKTIGSPETDSIINVNMWKFLEIEELSDKNNIPINSLKRK